MCLKVKLLLAIFACVSCVEYRERPTLETSDGNLILRAGLNKNITLRTNGRFSYININDKNLNDLIMTGDQLPGFSSLPSPTPPEASYTDLLRNLMRRVATLEVQSNASNNPNPNLRIVPLRRRVFTLERQVRTLNTLLVTNECMSSPCKNGGTCFDMFNGFLCTCPSNWEGPTCQLDVNECARYAGTDLGCQHGTCLNKQGSYECVCATGWFGGHCSQKTLDCSGSDLETCGHGTCIPTNTSIKCLCDEGWRTNGLSVMCNEDVDECLTGRQSCSASPKVECINLPGTYKCASCPPGYAGDGFTCVDVDECLQDNGGCSKNPRVSCMNTMGSRICGPCPPGYEGDGPFCTWRGSCARQNGGCHPSATCVENTAISMQFMQCICPEGMQGSGVGLTGCYVTTQHGLAPWVSPCHSNPCQHGTCYRVFRGYTCVCDDGYFGMLCDRVKDNCTANPCKNGGVCKHDNSTKSGYHCECSAQYTGKKCETHVKVCGGILDNTEGSIIYPLYNSSIYNHNARCAWIIQTSSDKVLIVTFTKFNLEHSSECGFDWLQIHDGRSSANRLIGRFCGNNFPNGGTIISTHNSLYLWFSSDRTVAKGGFTLHWHSVDPKCGGELAIDSHGQISSPGSPGTYPPSRDCYWALTAPAGKRIQIHFFLLQMEAHPNCSFDYLEILDGTQLTDPLLFKYCNSSQPPPLLTPGPQLLIHFHSDAYNTDRGFQLSYAVANGVPGCGGLYTASKGEITPPTLSGNYIPSVTCDYKIVLVPGSFIKIKVLQFNLEYSTRCRSDSITIYDGDTSSAKLIGTFCGSTSPAEFISSTNKLLIIFKSDLSIGGNFKLSYEIHCELSFTDMSGVIQSPGYPVSYARERQCHFKIKVPVGNVIKLEFSDFDIESGNNECIFDMLEIKDGENQNAKSLGKFCGDIDEKPPTLLSTHNYMYLIFTTDNSVSGTGFSANYTAIYVGCGGIYTDSNGIITHPTPILTDNSLHIARDSNCSWILSAPDGYFIQLSWNIFTLSTSSSCSSAYVEIFEVDTETLGTLVHSFGKFCGPKMPPAITSIGNKMKIKFQSDWVLHYNTFSLTYMFRKSEAYCGGRYLRTHGNITSPGFPKPYRNRMDCTWFITVPYGQQIMLKVLNFSIERNVRICNADYLEIRNGGYDRAPLIGKFCGNNIPKMIPSIGNALYLHFKSDSSISGKGFQIEWTGTTTGCGGTVSSSSGSVISPNYPQPYGQNTECYWRIATSAGSAIQISFSDVDLASSGICIYDFIEIYDGRTVQSPKLGRFCTLRNSPIQLISSSNHFYIRLRSDISVEGNGFSLNYHTVCNREVTGFKGVIESLDFPNQYPNNVNCTWTVKAPLGNRINVTFSSFQLESTNSLRTYGRMGSIWTSRLMDYPCAHDQVTLKDGTERSTPLRYCGSVLPPKFTTNDNILQVHFKTDSFLTFSGFRLEWVVYGCGGHLKQFLGSLTTPSVVNGNIVCEWLIETEPGTSVEIRVVTAHMKPTVNCTQDALSVYNGPNKDAVQILHICDSPKDPVIVTSNSNFMFVRFSTESGYTHSKLVGTYRTISPAICGGTYQAHTGVITSPNYPKDYNFQSNCFWTIRVPTSYLIQLNFKDWDINSRSNCKDSLKIYDGVDPANTQNGTVVTYCGNQTPKTYISKNNEIKIEFTTSDTWTAKGFKIEYSIACGANIEAAVDGIITSLRALTSLDSRLCNWTISAPRFDQRVSLTFTYLDVPQAGQFSCLNNSILVYDGMSADAPLMGTYCGRKAPPTIVSRGSALTFILSSSTGRDIGKFSAHYTVLDTACGGNLEALLGTIASPSYPDNYPMNIDCIWTIKTSPGNTMLIDFQNFNLLSSENCNEDYLEIREKDGIGKLVGFYCDDKIPPTLKISEPVYIKFRSGDGNSAPGFILDYVYQTANDFSGNRSGKISSPLYPKYRIRNGEYTWRLMTQARTRIMITIGSLYLENLRDSCQNNLELYDGYDNTAPLLINLCASLNYEKVLFTMSNLLFVKFSMMDDLSEGLFSLDWTEAELSTVNIDKTPACSGGGPRYINRSDVFTLNSPGYPKKYNESLKCEWIFETDEASHLYLKFVEIALEETYDCYADKILIHSFNKETDKWEQLGHPICLADSVEITNLTATNLMKVSFESDAYVSKVGFSARIYSICGGTLTQKSGVIEFNPTLLIGILSNQATQCEWTVKVGPGQMIQVEFMEFNIPNDIQDTCDNYLVLKNGGSKDSPNLGKGKYCLNKELKLNNPLVTLGNMLYVKVAVPNFYQRFEKLERNLGVKLRYFEKKNICGSNRVLDAETQSFHISSPNFPNVPYTYTECVWTIMAPPGEIIRFEIIERFDLTASSKCDKEFVEIRDGGMGNSPWLGTYCGSKHPMLRTTGNMIYVKFVTSVDEPRNGFKANISIDTCGGTFSSPADTITSPGYPAHMILPEGTICEWHIIVPNDYSVQVNVKTIELPQSKDGCETYVKMEGVIPSNNTRNMLAKFCDSAVTDQKEVRSSLNKVIITLVIGKPHYNIGVTIPPKGFQITYYTTRAVCGGQIKAASGTIMSPEYPHGSNKNVFCNWYITAPKGRRITLRFEDVDLDIVEDSSYSTQRMGIYNDHDYFSLIKNLPNGPSKTSFELESSGNLMLILFWSIYASTKRGFKASFTSDKPTSCVGSLNEDSGRIISNNQTSGYYCEWERKISRNAHSEFSNTTFVITITNMTIVNATTSPKCQEHNTSLYIIGERPVTLHTFCSSFDKRVVRLPTNDVKVKVTQGATSKLNFYLDYVIQPCGGQIKLSDNDVYLQFPSNRSGSLDCMWSIEGGSDNTITVAIEGDFTSTDYTAEFLNVYKTYPDIIIGEYYKDRLPSEPIRTNFAEVYVEYHAESFNSNTNLKVKLTATSNACGGALTHMARTFHSPNFPKRYTNDQECIWDIETLQGYRVSLSFVTRFYLEETVNCTKDFVEVFDFISDNYKSLGRFCGRTLPGKLMSTNNKFRIMFRSDSTVSSDGFKAIWQPICGGTFEATEERQWIVSPGWPANYQSMLDCVYNLTASEGKNIDVTFDSFSLESGTAAGRCKYDNLTMTGNDWTILTIGPPITVCGTDLPQRQYQFKSAVKIQFQTDRWDSKKGFRFSFSYNSCISVITSPGSFSSPKVLNNEYERNLNCLWNITAPKGKVIVLKFNYFDTEHDVQCSRDYVSIFDGLTTDENHRLALLCGSHNDTLPVIRSTTNQMAVAFVTDYVTGQYGFEAEIMFTYGENVGCGGNYIVSEQKDFNSPRFDILYMPFLDCHWLLQAPEGMILNMTFKALHVMPCYNVNQTEMAPNNCTCDYLEVRDGASPIGFLIGRYCGHSLPHSLISTGRSLYARFVTDGTIESSGFQATLTSKYSDCGPETIRVTNVTQNISSQKGPVLKRGTHCKYFVITEYLSELIHVQVKSLDMSPPSALDNNCHKDKLQIFKNVMNNTYGFGKDLVMSTRREMSSYIQLPSLSYYTLCGKSLPFDFYVEGALTLTLITSPEEVEQPYSGFDIDVKLSNGCSRNFTQSQGRILINFDYNTDCYQYITAPKHHTISIYFISTSYGIGDCSNYIEVYDGKDEKAKSLTKMCTVYSPDPIFSSGRYLTLLAHSDTAFFVGYDLNFATTDKGSGCGGELYNELGAVTSPLYPQAYRKNAVCAWTLHTLQGSKLHLEFQHFDLGSRLICDNNYLELVDRQEKVVRAYCANDMPANYISPDNYVKLVFHTSRNNGGQGWHAKFKTLIDAS